MVARPGPLGGRCGDVGSATAIGGGKFVWVLPETLHGGSRDDGASSSSRSDATAHQLWPAARAAARLVARLVGLYAAVGRTLPCVVVCELGCGLGAPALAAAAAGARTLATDYDGAALRRVEAAAEAQGLDVKGRVFDLTSRAPLPAADLYVFADVVADAALQGAVERRAREALDAGSSCLVALERSRPQRTAFRTFTHPTALSSAGAFLQADVLMDVAAAAVAAAAPALLLLDVDEDDVALYVRPP